MCVSNAREISDHAKEFQRGHWSFLGPENEEKCHRTSNHLVPTHECAQHIEAKTKNQKLLNPLN